MRKCLLSAMAALHCMWSTAPCSLSKVVFDDFSQEGKMTPSEFKRLCRTRLRYEGADDAELDAAFVQLDSSGSGFLDLSEFQQWWQLEEQRSTSLMFKSDEERDKVCRIKKSFFQCTDGLGTMTPEQFRLKCYMSGYCLSDEELQDAFAQLDKDSSGVVDFVEYLAWRCRDDRFAHLQHDEDLDPKAAYVHQVGEYFRLYDTELLGYLDQQRFRPLYQHLVEHGQVDTPVETVMQELDSNGDGRVSLNDFIQWYLADYTEDWDEVAAAGEEEEITPEAISKASVGAAVESGAMVASRGGA